MNNTIPPLSAFSPYLSFTREEWAHLRDDAPLPLTEAEIKNLQGINERLSIEEVNTIYLPLSRLLNLYATASQKLHQTTNVFLNKQEKKVPYIIGVAGSVAVGKSTTSRIIQALLSRWDNHPKVELVTTDGFLYPNHVLESKGLLQRKGFPESYNIRRLMKFLYNVKSGNPNVEVPLYSHLAYDILPDVCQTIQQPDILIVEGINILQTGKQTDETSGPQIFVSDFLDFSVYVDASEQDLLSWYLQRFEILRETAFQNPASYFHRYASLSKEEALQFARGIWKDINGMNLRENILPTKYRATLILEKASDHSVEKIQLRKI
ncbi:type I pantothenate kinase [Aneurinibacillus aneurinilyticus]|jgi:type I pantothenate kinase|nr:type I pantothenate kinase [Aneurinibacillus aneurinilyticus]MCI1694235.1 type I pantothenate kinase [Aneurinibacillus aneurinilyticus]MED0671345.1 type I pantothenate kinase [Aneurinibacillus aneurinilyticus]MED0707769.1 type I pantothenate kinase [Aneurinibacillus aneurinilyticus]MED0722434.1 type I pantothenate kinase [Aneurinibacillus aneurinilyticus]MED0733132.1 type I pantothenate kinase [Aneurinibacillus aneurinilyticus]